MAGWLAGLDAFAVGLAYLGALLTTRFVVRPLLLGVLGSAPVIGGWLTGRIDQALSDFERNITPAANASMGTLISAWDWATAQVRGVLGGAATLAEETYSALWHLGTITLPQAVQQGTAYLEGRISDARSYAWGLLQTAEHDIDSSLLRAEAEAQALVSVSEGALRQEISAAEGIVLSEIRKGEQVVGQLFQQAEHDAELLVAASEAKVVELVKIARADLSAGVAAVEHDLQLLAKAERVALEDSVSILGGDLAAAEARANQAITALEESTAKSIEGILSGLPWQSLAAVIGVGEEILKADVRTLVGLGAQEIRKAIGDAEAIRAKYGPEVRAALAQLKAR